MLSQTYRFMYQQHMTSSVTYVFIRLTDTEDRYFTQTYSFIVNFIFQNLLFLFEGAIVASDNSRALWSIFLSI